MDSRQLIIAVEGTAALGSSWRMIVTNYLEKIIRSFVGKGIYGQIASSPNVELALVIFNAHGSHSGCIVQRTDWTKFVDTFLKWLYAIPFTGGGFTDYVAVTEGLSEALMMFSPLSPSAGRYQQNVDGKKHCILVAASDPCPFPTPVFRPQLQSPERNDNTEPERQPESRLSDAEGVAKSYALCSISLSVICPKDLPKLRAIYNAGKQNPHAAETPVDAAKSTLHLVLISDNFKEAHAALSRKTFEPNTGCMAAAPFLTVSNGLHSTANYVKVWEGNLIVQLPDQILFVTRLECYRHRHTSAPEKLAENWPSTLLTRRLTPQNQMNEICRQYLGKADYLVFRALDSHNFLEEMHEKMTCAVICLVSQTLVLSAPDEPCRLIGMLFPWEIVASNRPQTRDAHTQQRHSNTKCQQLMHQIPQQQLQPQPQKPQHVIRTPRLSSRLCHLCRRQVTYPKSHQTCNEQEQAS